MVHTCRRWHTGRQFCYTSSHHPVEYADYEELEKHAGRPSIVKSYNDTAAEGTPGGGVTVSFQYQREVDVLNYCDERA